MAARILLTYNMTIWLVVLSVVVAIQFALLGLFGYSLHTHSLSLNLLNYYMQKFVLGKRKR